MKYTVVIRQPVPEAVLGQLSQELSQQFELNAEQASKLASRRNGRLMKPTSRKRAERLLEVFQGVGAQVTLEEVRDDTTLVNDPYASERPGLVGPASLPITAPVVAAPFVSAPSISSDAGYAPPGSVQPAYGETDYLSGSGYVGPSPYGSGPLTAGDSRLPGGDLSGHDLNGSLFSSLPSGSSDHISSDRVSTDWGSAVQGSVAVLRPVIQPSSQPGSQPSSQPGAASPARPSAAAETLAPADQLDAAYSLEGAHSPNSLLGLDTLHGPNTVHSLDGVMLPSDPLEAPPAFVQRDGQMIRPEHVVSGVPEMNLGNLLGRPATSDPATSSPAPASVSAPVTASRAASEPISDDAWADFTGSLGSGAASAALREPANPTSVMMVDPSLDPVRGNRRSSLSRRVLLSTLLPLGLFTLLTLGFLVYALPRAQSQLITENAQAVAVAVGSNLDVTDQNTVYAQLDALIKRSAVGFVQVNLPDGTTFFRSKNAYTDGPLSEKIAAWVQQHPGNSTFVQSGSPADSYRYQLSLLEQVGAGTSDQAKALQGSVADPANQTSSTVTYLLSSINVTQNAQAERVVAQGIKPTGGTPLYSIVVGVPGDAAFAQLRNTLLLILGVALLAFVVAALLAARTARLVVQPIERLVLAADAISMGDLDQPVTVERNDEIGDLAQALERMRLSLEAAMERLRKRRKGA